MQKIIILTLSVGEDLIRRQRDRPNQLLFTGVFPDFIRSLLDVLPDYQYLIFRMPLQQ